MIHYRTNERLCSIQNVTFYVVLLTWFGGLWLAPATAQESAHARKATDKLEHHFRWLAHGAPSSDGEIRAIKTVHGEAIFCGAPGLTDAFRSSLVKVHQAGMKAMVIYSVGIHNAAAKAHPEWTFRRRDGANITIIGTVMCFNSPYRDFALAEIGKLVKEFPIDGLFLDLMWWGNMGTEWCCCDHCKRAYRDKFQIELPEELDWHTMSATKMKQAIEWRRDSLEETYQSIYDLAKSIRPELPVSFHGIVSWHVGRGSLTARFNCLRLSDIAYIECYGDLSFYTAWLRGVSKRPVVNSLPLSQDGFATQLSNYLGDTFNAGSTAIVAHGGRCTATISHLPDGTVSDNAMALVEKVYRQIKEKQSYLIEAKPVCYAAIVNCEPAKIYYRRENEPYVTMQPIKWLPEVIDYTKDRLEDRSPLPNLKGAFDVFQKLHVPVEFLSEMDLDLENLRNYRVVVLPNSAILTTSQVEALTEYVQQGGSILATYETSLCNDLGEENQNFDLAHLFGLNFVTTQRVFGNIFQDGSALEPSAGLLTHLTEHVKTGSSLKLWIPGPYVVTQVSSGETRATVKDERPGDRPPAVQINSVGKGKSAYICAPIFKIHTMPTYPYAPQPVIERFHGNPYGQPLGRRGWITDLTGELLDELAPNPPLEVEGPEMMETTFFEQPDKNRYVVHLFNSTTDKFGNSATLPAAKIRIRSDFLQPRAAYSAWPERKPLQIQKEGIHFSVAVPETQIHQIIVLEK